MQGIFEFVRFRIVDTWYRIQHRLSILPARIAARRDGWDPDEVIPVGSSARLCGDLLTDGAEYPAWMFYAPETQQRFRLSPLGPMTPTHIG